MGEKMFWYGSPFLAQGAGRIKTDPLNQQRIQLVLNRYQQWVAKNNLISNLKYSVTKQQVERSKIIFPLAGLAIGALSSYSFVHINSRYIGKFFTLFTIYLGWKVHQHYLHAYNVSRKMGNFPVYPTEIRKMIENNDSRYGFKWLGENYLDIQAPGVPVATGQSHEQAQEQ